MKKLGFTGTLSLVVGNIIGVGIFTTTGYLTNYLQTPLMILLAWFVGGLYALSGARVYGILCEAYPLSGGDYQYLKHELHPLAAYLFGWSALFVTYSGSIAALGIAAAYYLNVLINIPGFDTSIQLIDLGWFALKYTHMKIFAIGFIIFFSWINFRGIYLSGIYQMILTAGIYLLLILFSVCGLFSPAANYSLLFQIQETNIQFSGFLVALVAVIFSYSGWTTAIYVAEEVNQAYSTIPKALRIGVILVGMIYLLINLTYFIAIPVSDMPDVINLAAIVFERLWGTDGAAIVSFVILIAVLSSLNSTILSGPRIYMAMGREGYFASFTADLHQRFKSPYRALYLQMIWSMLLVISGSFNELLNFVIFVIIGFSLLAAWMAWRVVVRTMQITYLNFISIGFYMLFCLLVLINILIEKPVESMIGFIIVSIAIPLYYFENKRNINKYL